MHNYDVVLLERWVIHGICHDFVFVTPLAGRHHDHHLLTRITQLEHQLQLYTQLDSVGRIDYALWSAGAYVITALTSPTYVPQLPWLWWPSSSARPTVQWKAPELALTPELHLGYCWAMLGSNGNLGVALARSIIPRAVTVDHVAKPLLLQFESAPRDIEVWFVPELKHGTIPTTSQAWGAVTTALGADILIDHSLFNAYRRTTFVNLVNFTYDVHASRPAQTFEVSEDVYGLKLKTNTVLFRILTNWGSEAFTCLYRVRVHGED